MKNHFLFILLVLLTPSLLYGQKHFQLNCSDSHTQKVGNIPDNETRFVQARTFYLNKDLQNYEVASGDKISIELFDGNTHKAVVSYTHKDINGVNSILAKFEDLQFSFAIITIDEKEYMVTIDIPEKNQKYKTVVSKNRQDYFLLHLDNQYLDVLKGGEPIIGDHSKGNESQGSEKRIKENKGNAFDSQGKEELKNYESDIGVYDLKHNEKQPVELTVMIVYTPAALAWAELNGGMNNIIAQDMVRANNASINSELAIDFVLVYSGLVDYTEVPGNPNEDLGRLRNQTDGYMDEVHIIRDVEAADFVHLLIFTGATGGLGYLLNNRNGRDDLAFALTRVQQAGWTNTVIHEIGHNMSAHHAKGQNTQPGPTNWSNWAENNWTAGWRFQGNDNVYYCDLMTYRSGIYWADGITSIEIPYFSNPNITYQGQPTGHPDDGDNSRSIIELKNTMANYRILGTYCLPTAILDDNTGITSVVFNTIDNSSSGAPAYTDQTDVSTTLYIGETYNLSVRVNTGGNYTVNTRAWIDWNQNWSFEPSEMYDMGLATNVVNGLTGLSPISVTVPPDATSGPTAIRIRTVWDDSGIPTPCGNQNYSEVEDYTLIVIGSLIWTGATDNDWHTSSNWNPEQVPTAFDNVTIPAGLTNYPTLSSSGSCNNILIGSTETSTATLLDNGHLTVHGTATVQRYIPRNGWHFLSSPVSGMNIFGSDFVPNDNPLNNNFDFYYFDEMSQVGGNYAPWINVRGAGGVPNTSNFTQFVAGRGYLVNYTSDYTPENPFAFEGSLQTGAIGVTVSHGSTSPAIQGWNLIGNPYPSAINWATADKSLFADNNAYVYDPIYGVGGGYRTETGIIAAHQGLFVKAKDATSHNQTFNFTEAMRAHGGIWRNNEPVHDALTLKLTRTDNGFFDETFVRVNEQSLIERDRDDALKLFSFNPQMPQLFTQTADNVQVAINSIPEITDGLEIYLGVLAPVSGSYKLELVEASGIFANTSVWLHNLIDGGSQNISSNPSNEYFIANGTHQSHFKLTFAQPTNIAGVEEDAVSIHTWNSNLYINFKMAANQRQLRMFDTSGRQVMARELGQGSSYTVPLNLQPGVYVVQVASPGGVVNKRVFVR